MANQLVQEPPLQIVPSMAKHCHVLLVTFPAQGHINPALQFAKRLVRMGVRVTFTTTLFAHRRITKSMKGTQLMEGLNLVSFSDGYDDGYRRSSSSDSAYVDTKKYISEMKSRGSKALKEIIQKSQEVSIGGGEYEQPISRIVYTLLLPWAVEVARECHVSSALLWIQPASILDIYYFYYNGYEDEISKNFSDPNWSIQLPGGLPLLSGNDLPSFFGSSIYNAILDLFKEQLDALDEETEPKILVNTFDTLEPEALKAIEKYNLIAVGPLALQLLDGKDLQTLISFGGDLFEKSNDYIEWLNSKPQSSVVYISFGSILDLPKNQMEEIAKGLLETGRPFFLKFCTSIFGVFLITHCDGIRRLSIVCGVPVVAFPQWTDQKTNAKLLEDVWKTGVRVRAKDDGIVESDEIIRCIEIVMDGERRGEYRGNVNGKNWQEKH
ncbi:hypothetical protein Leryth_007673 [Lithospermum erythrorhizon]|nr:hypothetical protein Leryth_007673 [Lithospermum erythrorhizon]